MPLVILCPSFAHHQSRKSPCRRQQLSKWHSFGGRVVRFDSLSRQVFSQASLGLSSIIPAWGRHNLNNSIVPSNQHLVCLLRSWYGIHWQPEHIHGQVWSSPPLTLQRHYPPKCQRHSQTCHQPQMHRQYWTPLHTWWWPYTTSRGYMQTTGSYKNVTPTNKMAMTSRGNKVTVVLLVRWYFEPNQSQRITSRPKTMFNLCAVYSASKSSNHKLSKTHKISPDTNPHKTKNQKTHKHHTQNFRRVSPFSIAPVKKAYKARTRWYCGPFCQFINTGF